MSEPNDIDIEQLIAEFRHSGLRELHVRHDGLEIYLSNDADAAGLDGAAASVTRSAVAEAGPVAKIPAGAVELAEAKPQLPDGAVVVTAPYLGTFYRAPKPGAEPYVAIGDRVSAETELCLVEVMKLFTAVRAGTAGTLHAILADDGAMVAADQPLFAIMPD